MSKIICDVCGTTYLDAADHCPICGYSQSGLRQSQYQTPEDAGGIGKFAPIPQKQKAIFDYDEENPQEAQEEPVFTEDPVPQPYVYETYESPTKGNIFLVIILSVIIAVLLVAIGFLLFKFYFPNQKPQNQKLEETFVTIPVETAVEETTEPGIPCTSLVLTSGVAELNKEGQYWLLHVTVMPEDTTDELVFVSEDESIATVNKYGRVTAVSEGETYVHITCGEKQMKCKIVVRYEDAVVIAETEEVPLTPESVEHETLPKDAQESKSEEATEKATEATEETAPAKEAEDVVLKLKKKDLSSGVRGVTFTLELDCDLKPEDVTWLTLDSSVAIVKNGEVTTIGPGQTKIVAQYKGQQVECIIRCTFS